MGANSPHFWRYEIIVIVENLGLMNFWKFMGMCIGNLAFGVESMSFSEISRCEPRLANRIPALVGAIDIGKKQVGHNAMSILHYEKIVIIEFMGIHGNVHRKLSFWCGIDVFFRN